MRIVNNVRYINLNNLPKATLFIFKCKTLVNIIRADLFSKNFQKILKPLLEKILKY